MEEFDVNGAYSRLVADGKIDKTKVSGDDFIREYNTNDNYRKHVEDYMGTISTTVAKEAPTVAETPKANVTDLGVQPEAKEAPTVAETPETSVTDLEVQPKAEEAPVVAETPETSVTDLGTQPEAKEDDSAEAFNLEPMVKELKDESDAITLDLADQKMKLPESAEASPKQNREVILFGREDYEPLINYVSKDEYFKKYWPYKDPKDGKIKDTYGGIAMKTVFGEGENNDFMVNGQPYGLTPEENAKQLEAFRLIDDESRLIPTATGKYIWHRYSENDELPRAFRERVAKVTELLHNNADKETIDREVLQARKDLYGLIVKPYMMADGDVKIGDEQTKLSSVAKECIDSALENREGSEARVGQLYLEAIRKCMYSVDYTREYSHAIDKMNMTLRDHLYNEYAGRGKGRYKNMTDFEKTAESAYSYIEYVDALRKSGVSAEQINSVLKSTGSKSVFDSRARKDMDNLFALKNYEKMRQALSSANEDKALSEYSNALLGNTGLSTFFLPNKIQAYGYSFGYEDDGISASFQGHKMGVIISYDEIADLAKKRIKVDSYIKSKGVASALEKLQSSEDRISKGEAAVTILSAIKADYNDALWTKRNIDEAANAFAEARERNSEGVMASVWRVASAPFTHPFSGISETLTKGYDREDLDSASADAVRLAGMEKGRSVFGFQHRQAISMRLSAEHLAGNELSEQAQTTQAFEQAAGNLGEIALDMWVGAKGLGLATKLLTGFRKGARLANRFRKFGSFFMKDGSMGESLARTGKYIFDSTGKAILMPLSMPSTYWKDMDMVYADEFGNMYFKKNNDSFGKRWLENVAMLMSFEGLGKFFNPKLWVRANIEKELADVSFAKALDRTLRGQVGKLTFERSADAVFTGIPMMLYQSLEAAINGEDISKVWSADNTKAAIIAGIAMHYANPKTQLEALTGGRSAVAIPGRIAHNLSLQRIYDSLDARSRKLAREVREAADDKEINAIISAEVERIKAIGDEEMRKEALAKASKALSFGLQEKGVELALAIEKAGAEAPEVKTEGAEPNPASATKEGAPEIKAEEEKPAAEVEESKGEESPSLLSRIRTKVRNVFRKKEDEAPQTKEEAPATEVKADVEPERKAETEPERTTEAEPERKVEAERKDEAEAEPERKGDFADGDIILTTETDAEGKERSQQWRVSEGADGELWAVPEGEATDLRRVRLSAIAHRATPGEAVTSVKTPLTEKPRQEQKSAISHTEPNFLEVPPEVRREQGYVYHNGMLVQRQTPEDVGMILGNGVEISFGNDRPAVNAQYALVPIDKVQAAHVDEHRNPLHFIPEAQPKERDVNDGASVEERTKMKNAFRPHAITIGDMSAFSGAPIVNERGEAIQGNNRIALLKEILQMGDARAINAAGKYYSYLREHATELGIDPKDIRKGMMLVRVARVSDAQAIELGNIPDSNMTTGGERKLPSQQIVRRLSIGDKFNDFVAVLFGGNSADMSISDAIDKNGQNALEWLCRQGYISNAEYQSAMMSHRGKQRLTDDASDTMTRIVNDVVCQGATPRQVEIWKEQSQQRKSMMLSVLAKLISLPEERRKPVYDKVFRALELISEVEAIDEQFPKGGVPDTFRAIFQRMGQMSMLGESDRLRGFSVEDALLAAVIKGERNAQSLRLRQFMGRVVEHTDKTTVRDGELDFGPRKEMSVEEAIRSAAREQYGISDESIAEAQMLIDKKEAQYADGRLSVGQDGVRDEAVYEMTRNLVSDAVGKDNVIEVSDAEAREMLDTREDAVLMGSRTKTKMKAIEDYYADKDLDENARAVVDVFSGKADNLPIEVERADGKRRIIIRQGNESKAGTKHSLFRHFGTRSNYIEIDEIAMIPEIIAKGERVVTGKRVEYNYETAEGPCLRVTTEISKNNREVFSNFISNKKTLQSEYRQAQKGNTHLSAQTTDAEVMGTKVSENSENSAKDNVKYYKEWILSTPGGVVYGWTAGGKIYLNRDAMNPDAPIHEYTHLWDEMLRKKNPALWLRGKELLKRTSLWQEVLDDANYADIRADEDAVASEVHSRLTGREGAKLLAGILADGRIKPMERAGVLSQVKAWITDMYRELRGTFEKWSGRDLSKLSVEDFTRMTLRDLADGVNPRDYIVPESDARFSIRTEGAPRKTKTAYAAFVMLRDKDGKLSFHPKMIKGDSAGTPVLTWLNADTGIISRDRNGNIITNTLGRISVQNNSIDKNGKAPKSTPLAWRPGKHLAPYPNASQFKLGNGKMQGNIIFAEVEYAADKDYQTQAWEYGINANGKYVHSQAGLPYIPKDGFYMYRTNARPDVPAMIITGAYKVNRFLTDAEAKKLNQAAGGEWIERDGATIDKAFLRENGISDEQLEARKSEFDTSKLEGPRDESAKVMELEAYTPRAINFDDVNLKAAAKENGQNLDDYRNNYKTPQERGWRRENALNDGTLERPGANVGGGIEAEAVESMGVRMGVRVVVDRTLGSRGAYNPNTGEVRVNPDAHKSMADLERTMAHEIVGHKGIHSLLGKSFDKVCERVSHLVDSEADKALGSLFRNWGTMSRRERGAEYMAWLAEKGGENTNPGKWQRVCGYIRVAMRRMGFGFEVTDADVRYMLYVSAKRATKAGRSLSAMVESYSPAEREYIERLRTEAELSHDPMQDVMRMGEGDGWLQRPQSQFAPDGNGDMMMRTNIGVSPRELTEWGELMAQSSAFGRANTYGAGEKFTVNVVDAAYPIARFMAGVLGLKNAEQARSVNGYNNPYMNRERSASRSMTEYRRAMDIYKPRLADARVDAIGASLRVWPELRRKRGAAEMLWHVYISAKGGLERQEYHMSQPDAEARDYAGLTSMYKALLEIKANKRSDVKNAFELWARSKTGKNVKYEKASLELIEEFAKSKVGSLKDFCAEYEEWCMQGSRASKFWGIVSEMTGRMRRQMYESDLISSDSYHRLQFGGTLAEIYRDATGRVLDDATASQYPNLESMVKAGLIDEAYALGLRPLYTHYLPLKGEYSELSLVESSTGALEAAAEATNRHKGDMPSANIHSVEGHQNLTIDPVSVLLYDYMRSMSASFENEWRKQLADMVAAHEDSLGQGDEPMAVVCRNMLNIDAKLGKLLPGKGRDRKKTYEDNAVYVSIGGKSCAILFADQNVGRAINAPFVKPGPVGTLVRSMTRGFSTLFTSLNATFWGSNLLRDSHALVEYNFVKGLGGAKSGTLSTIARLAGVELKDAGALLRQAWGELGGKPAKDPYVREFFDHGARTAANEQSSRDEIEGIMKSMFKTDKDGNPISLKNENVVSATMQLIERIGEMTELRTRLLTYVAWRRKGASVEEAVHHSKEVSVNFDRRGRWARQWGLFQPFLNAAIQANRRDWELAKGEPLRFLMYRGIHFASRTMIALGIGYIAYNAFSDDESQLSFEQYLERYYAINNYTRNSYHLLPMGDLGTISFADALDNRPWNMLGDVLLREYFLSNGMLKGRTEDESPDKILTDMGTALFEKLGVEPASRAYRWAVSGIGSIPSVLFGGHPALAPMFNIIENRNHMGAAIQKEDYNHDSSLPEYTRDREAIKGTLSHKIAVWLNNATAINGKKVGVINLGGGQIAELGGSFGTISDITGTVAGAINLARGGDVRDFARKMIVLKGFYRQPIEKYYESGKKSDWFKLRRKADENLNTFKNMLKHKYEGSVEADLGALLVEADAQGLYYIGGLSTLERMAKESGQPWVNEMVSELKDGTYRSHRYAEGDLKYAIELLGRAAYLDAIAPEKVADVTEDTETAWALSRLGRKVQTALGKITKLTPEDGYNAEEAKKEFADALRDITETSALSAVESELNILKQ